MKFATQLRRLAGIAIASLGISTLSACSDEENGLGLGPAWEIWASDQSNSVAGAGARGINGSFIWIWASAAVEQQIAGNGTAQPLGCGPGETNTAGAGPCDLHEVFPSTLAEMDASGNATGNTLANLNGFGRLHGMLSDPQQLYVTANIFAPSGGYIGIIDTRTREAVALFRVTGTNVGGGTDVRSVHMSLWDATGSAIIIANLHGKLLERINVDRDASGNITAARFNRSASLGVGKDMAVTSSATSFSGNNAHGRALIGEVTGSYDSTALADLTPNNRCKENGCSAGSDGSSGGRPNNVIICPITSTAGLAYITLGGGGLLVANTNVTPMAIVGEYGNEVVNGAGCGGVQVSNHMFLNGGVSASGAGATQSTFTVYRVDDSAFGSSNMENTPAPELAFKDATNTSTIGNTASTVASNNTGQLPGTTTRRDAHGMAVTQTGYVHNVDRIRNNVEVFDPNTLAKTSYDLTSADGQGNGTGPCAAASVSDDPNLPSNDPAPDLLESTPDGKYLAIAFRGPIPVSVTHSAQGSCPGVGVVKLLEGGRSGQLVTVLRTTNSVDDAPASAPGGHAYTGTEHSDIHAAAVIRK